MFCPQAQATTLQTPGRPARLEGFSCAPRGHSGPELEVATETACLLWR